MSSGNGGGKGFFDNAVNVESFSGGGNFFENLGSDFLNFSTQALTGGIIGVENGKISNGASTNVAKSAGKAAVSGLKEVTGAKAAEQANALAREQFENAKADAETARAEAISQNAKDQMRMSKLAGAARNSASSRSTNRGTAVSGSVLGDQQDFLGL